MAVCEAVSNRAVNLADALQRVLSSGIGKEYTEKPMPVLLRDGMTPNELVAANRGVSPEFLRDFIAFLRKGCFAFAWDD
jgi:hypothetical protein